MTLADKLIYLRKKQGMSQEELASRLGISRQSVSKWESAQAMPDIDKIVELSKIFCVTTDALIKDEIEIDVPEASCVPKKEKRHVSYVEAESYLKDKFHSAYLIAIATFIAILSPGIMLILIMTPRISEEIAIGLGLSTLFLMISISVGIYVYSYLTTKKYEYISEEDFTLDYSVTDMLSRTEQAISRSYILRNVIATVLCILSPLPLIITAIYQGSTDFAIVISLTATLFTVGIGVVMFITSGIKRSAISALKDTKTVQSRYSLNLEESIEGSFWTITVAVYLLYSFTSGNWSMSWIIFLFAAAISGVISASFSVVRRANGNKNKEDKE